MWSHLRIVYSVFRRIRMLKVLGITLIVLGFIAAGLGVASASIWRPPSTITATTASVGHFPYIVVNPGVLALVDPNVTITASRRDGGPVAIVIGRDIDVLGWLEGERHTTVTDLASWETLATTQGPDAGIAAIPAPENDTTGDTSDTDVTDNADAGADAGAEDSGAVDNSESADSGEGEGSGEAADNTGVEADASDQVTEPLWLPPAPASLVDNDMWWDTASGEGQASMQWSEQPGRWMVLVASIDALPQDYSTPDSSVTGDGPADGDAPDFETAAAPGVPSLTLSWEREVETPLLRVGIIVGGSLVFLGLVLLILGARSRSRRAKAAAAGQLPGSVNSTLSSASSGLGGQRTATAAGADAGSSQPASPWASPFERVFGEESPDDGQGQADATDGDELADASHTPPLDAPLPVFAEPAGMTVVSSDSDAAPQDNSPADTPAPADDVPSADSPASALGPDDLSGNGLAPGDVALSHVMQGHVAQADAADANAALGQEAADSSDQPGTGDATTAPAVKTATESAASGPVSPDSPAAGADPETEVGAGHAQATAGDKAGDQAGEPTSDQASDRSHDTGHISVPASEVPLTTAALYRPTRRQLREAEEARASAEKSAKRSKAFKALTGAIPRVGSKNTNSASDSQATALERSAAWRETWGIGGDAGAQAPQTAAATGDEAQKPEPGASTSQGESA